MWLLIHFVLVCELYHALSWCEMCEWVINSLSTWPLHLTNDSTEFWQSQTASCFSTQDFRDVCIYKTYARGFPISCINGGIQSEGDERQKGKRRGSVKPTVSQHWGLIWWDSAAEVCVYTVISTWSAAQPTETGGGWKSRPSSCQWKKEQNTKKAASSGKSRNVMSYVIITQGFVLVQVNKTACRAFFKCHCGKQTRQKTQNWDKSEFLGLNFGYMCILAEFDFFVCQPRSLFYTYHNQRAHIPFSKLQTRYI